MTAHIGETEKWMRAVLYARVSTADKGQDPERQFRELREFAAARLWRTVELEDQMSAAKDRPGLAELWRLCRRRRVDVVAVHEFSRFARSVKELALALEEFQALGIQFVSLREQIDTTTPAGRLVYHVMAAIAEFERSMVRERVRSGLALRADQLKREGSFVSKAGQRRYRLGRPRAGVDLDYIDRRRREGASWAEIGRELKVSADTCKRAVSRTLLVNIFKDEDEAPRVPNPVLRRRPGRDRGALAKV